MNPTLAPVSPAEVVEAVRSSGRILAVGNETKPRLSEVDSSYTRLCTAQLQGIMEYEPAEYIITALAGTRVRELAAALSRQGQYLPFDPLFLNAGATLGGTVAAGTSGPGRFRYGGTRDFILGVQFVDGEGRLLRMGGKVVKNAAGFDLPKFFVGSLGRFGVLTEITLKVFPRPSSILTVRLRVDSPGAAARILTEAAKSRWQPDALDWFPSHRAIYLRLAGPEAALNLLAGEVLKRWPGEVLSGSEADGLWEQLIEVAWAHPSGVLIKAVLTPTQLPPLMAGLSAVEGSRVHVSAGGNMALLSVPSAETVASVDGVLQTQGLRGLTLRGSARLWVGIQSAGDIVQRVKQALDPVNRFPPASASYS
jgi:glycolate oxidase FAD binding subunit